MLMTAEAGGGEGGKGKGDRLVINSVQLEPSETDAINTPIERTKPTDMSMIVFGLFDERWNRRRDGGNLKGGGREFQSN